MPDVADEHGVWHRIMVGCVEYPILLAAFPSLAKKPSLQPYLQLLIAAARMSAVFSMASLSWLVLTKHVSYGDGGR